MNNRLQSPSYRPVIQTAINGQVQKAHENKDSPSNYDPVVNTRSAENSPGPHNGASEFIHKVRDPEKYELQLRDQIVTVVEKYMVGGSAGAGCGGEENLDSEDGAEIAIGQRTYYRGRFLGKVRISNCPNVIKLGRICEVL